MNRHLVVGAALSLLGGCTTTLDVSHLTSGDNPPQKGVSYFLPFTQFELTVSRTLNKCPEGNKPYEYTTQVTVVSTTNQPDADQEYSIDLTTLSNWWKTSDLKVTLAPGGLLQSFNATSADQTGPLAQNVLTGVGTFAATIATGGLVPKLQAPTAPDEHGQSQPTPPPVTSVPLPPCREDAKNALKIHDAKVIDKALDDATDKLNADSAALKALVASAPALGTKLDPESQRHILSAIDLVNKDIADQAAAQGPVTGYQKILTVSQTFRWPTTGKLDTPAAAAAATQTTPAIVPQAQQVALPGELGALGSWAGKDSFTGVDLPFEASIRLQRLADSEVVSASSDTTGTSGIRFRIPARGQLLLCNAKSGAALTDKNKKPLPSCTGTATTITLPATADAVWEGSVPQLGRVNFLPYQNRPFQSNVLSATFNADGTLATAEYSEPASAGVSASSAFSAAATGAAGTAKTIANAPTTQLNAQLARLQALNNITVAEATASSAAQANQLAQVQAANNLITARATQATADAVAQATANTTLLNALVAQDNAQTALKAAQASLAH